MSRVSISPCASYDPVEIEAALSAALSPLGGMAAFVSPGKRVLLKVNLLSRALPERAVTTHPEVVRAVIRAVRQCGGDVTVGDSPGGPNTPGQWRHISEDSGIAAVCVEEGVPLVLFDDDCVRAKAPEGSLYGAFTLGRAVTETDVLITLPEVQDPRLHDVHGRREEPLRVHSRASTRPSTTSRCPDRDDFGNMLVDLMLACKPALAIMDAVVGMEGEGPAGGTPRQVGALIASADCVALDVVASSMAGLDPMEVYSNKAAARRGLGPASIDEVEISGADWHALAPSGFALPARDISAMLPPWLGKRLRGWTTARPFLERQSECTKCKRCEESCPVDAIVVGAGGPVFDHSICIRCYCCQELCPPQVIGLKVPPVAKLMARGRRI